LTRKNEIYLTSAVVPERVCVGAGTKVPVGEDFEVVDVDTNDAVEVGGANVVVSEVTVVPLTAATQ
jgi:hypothetical protein